jgi:hypothetical protein
MLRPSRAPLASPSGGEGVQLELEGVAGRLRWPDDATAVSATKSAARCRGGQVLGDRSGEHAEGGEEVEVAGEGLADAGGVADLDVAGEAEGHGHAVVEVGVDGDVAGAGSRAGR